MKTYLIGWVLQFTLSNLCNDIVFLPQIHFDGIEIDEVDNWESTKKKNKCKWMMRLRDLSENQLFEQMTSQVYAEKKQSSLNNKLEEHPVPQA
jgi:hypothetical protein